MKNGILTFFFAFIPGAGQMYQGYMKRGLSLISVCCLVCVAAILLPPLLALLPIVWMYSFFDTFNLRSQLGAEAAPEDDYLVHIQSDTQLKQLMAKSHTLVGWALVALGGYALYDTFLMGTLRNLYYRYENSALVRTLYDLGRNLPTLAVCVALIVVGIWLVRGPRPAPKQEEPEDDVCHYGHAQDEPETQKEAAQHDDAE